jgi:hypothetical protein
VSADLLSDDPATRARAFEMAVLAAVDLDPLAVDLDRLAAAYRSLSDTLNQGRATPSSLGPGGGPFDAREHTAVFGLIYAARTFHAAHRILAAYPPGPGAMVELGAGLGPFALRAALQSRSSPILIDASAEVIRAGARLFEICGLPQPSTQAIDLSRFHATAPLGGLALPFVLNELPDRDDDSALRRRVARWAAMLSPNGRLYLLEPGTPIAARRLQRLRDALPPGLQIHAPCTGAQACPQLERPNDWCHFTWPTPESPLARTIADHAQRRWQEQHISFLVLGPSPSPPPAARVLDVRPHGHAKVVARTCTAQGLLPLTALRRHPAHAHLSALEPGNLVDLLGGEPKGDGLRVEAVEDVSLRSPL